MRGNQMTDHESRRLSIPTITRKAGRVMLIASSVLLAGILILVGVLQYWSYPGKPVAFVDEKGNPLPDSISEKVFVNINGVEEGMIIKGKDVANPMLLYLHGGMPDSFLAQTYPTGLEDDFTIVWWEQRGAGLSYHDDIPAETMNLEQMISDTLAVTNYLRQRFGKEKIYLMGHSGGTFIGIQAAARHPELYYAYIAESQMADQLQSEIQAYDYMLAQFREKGNTKMVQKLEASPVTAASGVPDSYYLVRDIAMHSLGIGTMHEMKSVVSGLMLPSMQFRDYTLSEKINLWRGKARTGVSSMWKEMVVTDLSKQVTELDIPVYFLHGVYDYTCSYTVAQSYFEALQAPVKGFYTFERSAHSPMFEEPEKVQKILREDVLTGTNSLADSE
jgi:pimeloyl-ACP methyl ester carboxylesterase